jgi:hypothetical protein
MQEFVYNRLITAARVEPPTPHGFSAKLPEDDALPNDLEGIAETLAGVAVAMEYVDSKGAESRRRVIVRNVIQSSTGRTLLRCFCCERKAMTPFAPSRIAPEGAGAIPRANVSPLPL